ncbi:helix-turn-helix domain-containing protein [Rhodococcus sp. ACT016]|uniref:helix-turn-helix domain-containing protein n=1 Tax=Rhodococcus sp. ACT016 TaxID=3134808 RepID=UPI003D2BE055
MKRYQCRAYPTGEWQSLARSFGCAQMVLNDAIVVRQTSRLAYLNYFGSYWETGGEGA